MIYDAMEQIRDRLQSYLQKTLGADSVNVVIDNIAMAEQLGGPNNQLIEGVIMSLVNLQEETTLKNAPHYRIENGRSIYQNPPVYLNLFILFSILNNQYATSIRLLSRVVEFFQTQNELSFPTTPVPAHFPPPGGMGISQDIKIFADLYSLTFEQLNHLWGALGGKQVPFVLYRARLVAVQGQKRQAEGKVITEILVNE